MKSTTKRDGDCREVKRKILKAGSSFLLILFLVLASSNLEADPPKPFTCDKYLGEPGKWGQEVGLIFVGQVIEVSFRGKAPNEFECDHTSHGASVPIRYRIVEVLRGDLRAGTEVRVGRSLCGFVREDFPPGKRNIVAVEKCHPLATCKYQLIERDHYKHYFSEYIPYTLENRNKAKLFISCLKEYRKEK